MRGLAEARGHGPGPDPSRTGTHSRSISTRRAFFTSGARGTRGTDFTGTSSGASLTTGTFATFFASRTRRTRGSSISLDGEKRGCQIPLCLERTEASGGPTAWAPTCSPRADTHRGARRTNSASSTRETSSTLEEENEEVVRGRRAPSPGPAAPTSERGLGTVSAETPREILTGGPALPRAPLGPGAPTLPCRRAQRRQSRASAGPRPVDSLGPKG